LIIIKLGFTSVVLKRHRFSFSTARSLNEYDGNLVPSKGLFTFLKKEKVDVISFLDGGKSRNLAAEFNTGWLKSYDILLMHEVRSFQYWWTKVGKKTRNMVRKAEKNGVITSAIQPSGMLAKDICRIYNSTQKKQKRRNNDYGKTNQEVLKEITSSPDYVFIVSCLNNEVVGFSQLVFYLDTVFIKRLLSLENYRDKGINNALLAKAIEISADRGVKKLIFAHWNPWTFPEESLINFAINNGFRLCKVTRYYAPLTWNGKVLIHLLTRKKIIYAIQWLNSSLGPIIRFIGDSMRSSTI
jgi:GNAT superfamily N-acetyltransferase